ncbi:MULTISPECIES: ABC transporter permease [Methanosarcina]|uniref:Dipeptide transport system permease protein DppB n=3 Tax=Methanosarcina barkeri TaxID=2208 RepID=A0A0E3QQ35_METBA|nr:MULTISPECIES: ABC transporter permease [Methanosarcina]AKB53383.1 Dipeptide transport system permease protein DppB [Methanosarcina barkeri MS]AKB58512.1 Dipeptide transport system permease protein DppB [Methanosarcina barkeri 227]AKJ39303.1 dipeptide/oligopeptide/nickel ABC transporter permease protein [Methanosarcina barkeri CM1]OED09799.1 glutathione ABC transporter permease GsiC [Methanosarcina sp. A14]
MKYFIKRVGFMALTLFAVCALTFFLMNVIPGGTAELVLKHTFVGLEESVTDEQLNQISDRYDLDDPLYLQFFKWVKEAVLKGDIGTSYVFKKPVLYLLALRLPATIQLAVVSMLIAILAGVSLGIYSALRENKISDHILRIVTLFGVSMPGFWVALLLILIFSLKLKLVPVTGYGSLENLLLPATALSLHSVAAVMRVTRTSMLETLGQEYIRFAKAKGLPIWKIVSRHALKNAMLPVITVIGFQMGSLLGGTVVIEKIFAWPGIGSLLVDSISARDLPVVQGCVLAIVTMFLFVHFFVDILYTHLDPRIRYG